MAKIIIFLLIVVLVVLSFFNKGTVSLTVWKDITYDNIPLIALIFISTMVGMVSMFVISAVRDTKRRMEGWQVQRRHKKETKVLDTYTKGLDAFLVSQYAPAEELFTQVLEYDSANFNSLLRLGDIYLKQGEFGKAEEYYYKAKEVKPKSIEMLLSLERVAETQKNWQEAIKYLDNILEIESENRSILVRKREILEMNGKWEELVELQQKILKGKLDEKEADIENRKLLGYKYELGCHYLKTGASDKALKSLKAIIKADKNFVAAYLSLAEAHIAEGNEKEAQSVLMKGYEETSSLIFLVRLEDLLINKGEPGAIIDVYKKAVQKDPKDLRLQFFLAKLYHRLEMIDDALDSIGALDSAGFDSPDLHGLIGSVYERRSEYEKAAAEFKKALDIDKQLLVPYCCSNCHFVTEDWSGRCPECGIWNTLILDTNEICKNQKRQSSS